jgi:phospholipase/carboxylesterase
MSTATLSFVHRFVPALRAGLRPLLMLHGTGGDESDLLDLGRAIAPGTALLSPRGQAVENGMPRFFRRLAEGVFDEADLVRRTGDLVRFVAEARGVYGLAAPVAVGFSNGANIAAATLLLYPKVLAGAVLLRPMAPFVTSPTPDLAGTPVLMLSGAADPIVPGDNAARLAATLERSGAAVDHQVVPAGHALTQMDLRLAEAWYRSLPADGGSAAGAGSASVGTERATSTFMQE